MTREEAIARLAEREGIAESDRAEWSMCWTLPAVLAALDAPEGQPCNDCGRVVVWREDRGWWIHEPANPGCFLAAGSESEAQR